jgi:hypothetical protein
MCTFLSLPLKENLVINNKLEISYETKLNSTTNFHFFQ